MSQVKEICTFCKTLVSFIILVLIDDASVVVELWFGEAVSLAGGAVSGW